MGIQKTNLNDEKIIDIMAKNYGIEVLDIVKVDRGTSNIFVINTYNKKFILKEFISKRKKDTIIKETHIINFLEEKNINVPKYLKTINGEFWIENEGRIIIVQEFIEGYTIENNTGDYNKVIQCATVLGKLTNALIDYPELSDEGIIEKNFSKSSIRAAIQKMEYLKCNLNQDNVFKKQIEKDIILRLEILRNIEKSFDFNVVKNMTMLNSHGDFCSQQLIYNNSEEPVVIDFEKAKKLPIVWEVIRSYSYIDENVKDGNININILVDYFKEFAKYIKLSRYDLKYAVDIYLLQLTGSTYGYKEYNDDYSQEELLDFAFFRTKLCKNLYDNRETIRLQLLKNVK